MLILRVLILRGSILKLLIPGQGILDNRDDCGGIPTHRPPTPDESTDEEESEEVESGEEGSGEEAKNGALNNKGGKAERKLRSQLRDNWDWLKVLPPFQKVLASK